MPTYLNSLDSEFQSVVKIKIANQMRKWGEEFNWFDFIVVFLQNDALLLFGCCFVVDVVVGVVVVVVLLLLLLLFCCCCCCCCCCPVKIEMQKATTRNVWAQKLWPGHVSLSLSHVFWWSLTSPWQYWRSSPL